jgi:hypothetical protein
MAAAGSLAVARVLAPALPAALASAESPRGRSQDYAAGGVAFSWIFGEPSTRVRIDE